MRGEEKSEFLQADANIIPQHQNTRRVLSPGVRRSVVYVSMKEPVSVAQCGSGKRPHTRAKDVPVHARPYAGVGVCISCL